MSEAISTTERAPADVLAGARWALRKSDPIDLDHVPGDTARAWRLHAGESLRHLIELPDESIDAVICDPPYSSGGQFRGDRSRPTSEKYEQSGKVEYFEDYAGDNRDQHGYLAWCWLWMSECFRVLKSGGPFVCFSDWRQIPVTTDAIQAAGFIWRGIGVWDKINCRPQLGRYAAQCEYIVWGSKGPMPVERGVRALAGAKSVNHDGGSKEHPAQKPLAVMEWLCAIAPRGAIILDPFAGSGSTGVAALRTGRRFLGIEGQQTYFDIAHRRLNDAANQSEMFAIEEPGLPETEQATLL